MGREFGSGARGPGAGTISFDSDAEGRELVVGKGSLSRALGKLGGRLYFTALTSCIATAAHRRNRGNASC